FPTRRSSDLNYIFNSISRIQVKHMPISVYVLYMLDAHARALFRLLAVKAPFRKNSFFFFPEHPLKLQSVAHLYTTVLTLSLLSPLFSLSSLSPLSFFSLLSLP